MLPLWVRRASRHAKTSPLRALLAVASVMVTLYVAAAPMLACDYPPMTDLPFHAAHTSILRHYWDPSWHFHEQFVLQPIAVPYMLQYAVGALLMLALPPLAAVKATVVLMLLLVPAGMAVLLHGMKKSPLGALLTLPLMYCSLSHWGFISHVSALGLYAMSIGSAMLALDRPTALRRAGLAASLVLLFFTHIFRFPMGLAAVIGAAIFLYPATRRIRPILLPMAPALALFAIWLVVRPKQLDAGGVELHLDFGRTKEMWPLLFGGFIDQKERELAAAFVGVLGLTGAASLFGKLAERREPSRRDARFRAGAALVPIVSAIVLLGLYFALPMQIGVWWFVYPREVTAAAYVAIAILPGLPRPLAARAPLAVAIALAALAYGRFVAQGYAAFDEQTADFKRIVARLPKAPKLLYLIFDHTGSGRSTTPFIHLPAYVQAERGGSLSFNFASWGASPIVFRPPGEPGAVRPPPVPHRWEWTPGVFNVTRNGAFFDWFLVRSIHPADHLFKEDASIVRVDHIGKWWLYARSRGSRL